MVRVMATQLQLVDVRDYVTQDLIAATFHTALNGITVNCAPNVISPMEETQGTTHLGRRSDMVRVH